MCISRYKFVMATFVLYSSVRAIGIHRYIWVSQPPINSLTISIWPNDFFYRMSEKKRTINFSFNNKVESLHCYLLGWANRAKADEIFFPLQKDDKKRPFYTRANFFPQRASNGFFSTQKKKFLLPSA